jgi:hypothetical protein
MNLMMLLGCGLELASHCGAQRQGLTYRLFDAFGAARQPGSVRCENAALLA